MIRLIGEDTHPYLGATATPVTTEDATTHLIDRGRALTTLTREADSMTRFGAGIVAWLAGALAATGLASLVWSGAPAGVRVAGAALAAVAATGAVVLGRAAWRAGRAVVDAYCWWTLLPEHLPDGGRGVDGWRASPVRDAVAARVFVFQGWRPLRITAAVLSFLAPLVVLYMTQSDEYYTAPARLDGQGSAIAVFVLSLAVTGVTAGWIVMGGQWRAARAHAERDPVQRRILRRDH